MAAEQTASWVRYLGPYKRTLAFGGAMLALTNILALAFPILLERVIDAISNQNFDNMPTLVWLMIGFSVLTGFARVASRILIFNSARNAEFDLRNDLLSHLLGLEPAFFRERPIGDTLSRVTNDVQTVRALWGVGFLRIVDTLFAFGSKLALLLWISPMLTVMALVPYSAMVIFGRLFGRVIYKASREVQKELGSLSNLVQEDISGIDVIKTYALGARRQEAMEVQSKTLLTSNMKLVKMRGLLLPVLTAISSMSTAIVLWWGTRAAIDGRITVGELIAFNTVLVQLAWPTLALGWMLSLIQRGRASWSRLAELFARKPNIVDGDGAPLQTPVNGDIEVRDLTLTVGEQPLIRDINFHIKPGQTAAFVGQTGAGKSTLIQCLARLHDIPAKTIFIDGRDITSLPLQSLRRAIGYSPQEAFLFSRSILENIQVGLRNGEQVQDIVEDALRTAGLTRDLQALPKGVETIVGERGVTLSGGQRQRVALARALATLPPILLLDDSLSSVDAETEQEILGYLTAHLEGRTSVIVSHRVAAIKRCDIIFVMKAGAIVERGSHDELLAQEGEYASLYQSQFDPDAAKNKGAA